jgi:hypothetical protein
MDEFWERWRGGCQAMASIEYYFYYLDDWGLEGHEEDIEFEFVFVTLTPEDPATNRYVMMAPEDTPNLRVAVGAGHGSRAPNNTLVAAAQDDNRANHVLVELGGHASAPDAPPRPEFAKYIDVNWHPTDLWGTRDVLALAGSGLVGGYTPDMTLPRDGGLALQPHVDGSGRDRGAGYALLPVSDFRALDSLVATRASDTLILGQLNRIAETPGMRMQVPGRLDPAVRGSLELWSRPLCCGRHGGDLKPEKRRIWEHEHYRKGAAAILMSHLYRPTSTALQSRSDHAELWTWSAAWVPDDMVGGSVGFVIPVIFQKQIPVRIRGFLTFEVGWMRAFEEERLPDPSGGPDYVRQTQDAVSVRLTYDWSYSRIIGWYTAGQYTSSEWDHRDQRFDDSFALSGGASLLIKTADDRSWWKPLRALRLRVGPRFKVGQFDDLLEDVGVDIQVVFR